MHMAIAKAEPDIKELVLEKSGARSSLIHLTLSPSKQISRKIPSGVTVKENYMQIRCDPLRLQEA